MDLLSDAQNKTLNKTMRQESQSEEEEGDADAIPTFVVHQVIYLSIVAVIGTIANTIVLVKSIQNERKKHGSDMNKNSTNFLVISLALSDLGTSTFSVAVFILPSYVPNFPINEFFCTYVQPFRELFISVSIFSVALIAVVRYLILLETFRRKLAKKKLFSSCVIKNLVFWILSYLIFALPFSAVYKVDYADGAPVCETMWDSPMAQRVQITSGMLVNVLMPTLMVFFSYIGVIRRLRRARMVVWPIVKPPDVEPNQMTMLAEKSHRITKVSILLLITFFVTYLPYAILILAIEYNRSFVLTHPNIELLGAIAFCLLHSCAMINPIILIIASNSYRPKCLSLRNLFVCHK